MNKLIKILLLILAIFFVLIGCVNIKDKNEAENKYSRDELQQVMKKIDEYCQSDEYKNEDFVIQGYGIYDDLNKVVIDISSVDEDVIRKVEKYLDCGDAIDFNLMEEGWGDS